MPTRSPTRPPEGVINHDGKLWKSLGGATTNAEEFIAARTLFIELNNDANWNPWICDERSDDLDHAVEVMSQWGRAEPGHRYLTVKQREAQEARRELARENQRAKDEIRREHDKARYDEERATSRLRLIEVSSRLDYETVELAGLSNGTRFPAIDDARRASSIAESEAAVERLEAEIRHLEPVVGNLEDVVDEHGWLPRDRRQQT